VVGNYCYIFYDVPDDRLRTRIADVLKDYGLERIQKSVFFGRLSRNRVEELCLVLDDLIGEKEADVRIVFVPPSFVNKIIIVRAMYNIHLVEEEVLVA